MRTFSKLTCTQITDAVADSDAHDEHHAPVDEGRPRHHSRKRVCSVLKLLCHVRFFESAQFRRHGQGFYLPAASAPSRGATLATIPIKDDSP